ncbi:MAG: hypothetical protein ABEJ42_02615 [Halobacteriaceae archaeon]
MWFGMKRRDYLKKGLYGTLIGAGVLSGTASASNPTIYLQEGDTAFLYANNAYVETDYGGSDYELYTDYSKSDPISIKGYGSSLAPAADGTYFYIKLGITFVYEDYYGTKDAMATVGVKGNYDSYLSVGEYSENTAHIGFAVTDDTGGDTHSTTILDVEDRDGRFAENFNVGNDILLEHEHQYTAEIALTGITYDSATVDFHPNHPISDDDGLYVDKFPITFHNY